MMRLTTTACKEFRRKPVREQRKLLELVLEAADYKEGKLGIVLREPFRTLALSNSGSTGKERPKAFSREAYVEWLPIVDAFRTFCHLPGLQGRMLFEEIASLPTLAA